MVNATAGSVEKRTASEDFESDFVVCGKLPKVGNISLAETLSLK